MGASGFNDETNHIGMELAVEGAAGAVAQALLAEQVYDPISVSAST